MDKFEKLLLQQLNWGQRLTYKREKSFKVFSERGVMYEVLPRRLDNIVTAGGVRYTLNLPIPIPAIQLVIKLIIEENETKALRMITMADKTKEPVSYSVDRYNGDEDATVVGKNSITISSKTGKIQSRRKREKSEKSS